MSEILNQPDPGTTATGSSMSRGEIIKKFSEHEASNPVDSYRYLDWNCWPLLRIIACYQLNQAGNTGTTNRTQGIPTHLGKKFPGRFLRESLPGKLLNRIGARRTARKLENVLLNDARHQEDPGKPDTDVIILTHSGRRTQLDDSLYEIYSDPITEMLTELGLSCLVWEQGTERWPRHSGSAWITKRLSIARARSTNSAPETPPAWFRNFSDWSRNTFNYEIPWTIFRETLHSVQVHSELFSDWLANSGARLLVSVCWYDPTVMAATLAAKRLDIKTVDLQHGIQDSGHFAYSGWNHIPDSAYELVPDIFWSWGAGEAERLMLENPSFRKFSETIVGGNLWYNHWREDTTYSKPLPAALPENGAYLKTILVTLQHGPANFAEVLFELIGKCPGDWFWLIRLHPATPSLEAKYIKEKLDSLSTNNIDHKIASSTALYTLLGNCNVHITGHSTCALEALGFGIPTITVNENGTAAFRKYINLGVILSATNSVAAKEAINNAGQISAEKCRDSVSSVFATSLMAERGISTLLQAAGIQKTKASKHF